MSGPGFSRSGRTFRKAQSLVLGMQNLRDSEYSRVEDARKEVRSVPEQRGDKQAAQARPADAGRSVLSHMKRR